MGSEECSQIEKNTVRKRAGRWRVKLKGRRKGRRTVEGDRRQVGKKEQCKVQR